jgi:sugar-phosphatase
MDYQIKAVLFDLDGVVIDSAMAIERFWKEWAEKENVALDEEKIRKYIHGRRGNETIDILFSDSTPETKESIQRSAIDYDEAMTPGVIKGLHELITHLHALNIPIGLVTSSHIKRATRMLQNNRLDKYFTAIISREDVQHGKPHPEPYLKMAEKLNIQPFECLVFEDADSGIQAALDAGMHVIAIGNQSFDKVVGIITDFTELALAEKQIQIKEIMLRLSV